MEQRDRIRLRNLICTQAIGLTYALLWGLNTPILHAQDLPPVTGLDCPAERGFVESDGVRIHYVQAGDSGPLVVMLHGFPDYWRTWREQMPALAESCRVVALDLRGYNRSDQPEGVENYRLELLVDDVLAVLDHFEESQAVIVGHDWGGVIAWEVAMRHPDRVSRLIILNLPHPTNLRRELRNNPAQKLASSYAYAFQQPNAEALLSPSRLALWVNDPEARERYVETFERSSITSMLNYYRANFPTDLEEIEEPPPVTCPTLVIHGLKDVALLPGALNGTWERVEAELTLVTIPEAGHFVQQDAAETVTNTMTDWLDRQARNTNEEPPASR